MPAPATDPLDPLEAAARAVLPEQVYDFFAGGAGDESALAENLAAWQGIRVRPRVLQGAAGIDTSTVVLGSRLAAPIAVAPMGYQRLAHPDGEQGTAAATAASGLAMGVSTYSTASLEDVAAAAGTAWFQAYVLQDRGLTAELLTRAAAAGYRAILLTVDAVVAGDRRRDRRHGYELPHEPGLGLPNLGGTGLSAAYSTRLSADLTADTIGWVREVSGLPVAVKGVLHPDDAVRCLEAGAEAVVVSNHGGRQLDAAVATAHALPEIAAAVSGRGELLVDGGVRSGSDVLRALALGARAVLIGRPVLWALATGGTDGVTTLLTGLVEDVTRCLRICGYSTVAEVGTGILVPPRPSCTSTFT